MKRVVAPELLDEDLGNEQEISSALDDLRAINRRLGGFTSLASLTAIVAKQRENKSLTLLDVAGGSGDVASHVSHSLVGKGTRVCATVLDRATSHLQSMDPAVKRVAGDALQLPFASQSFDVVSSNLFCHHLEPEEMIIFLNDALRVARLAVIASDLRRNLFHWLAAWTGRLIYRSRLTKNDAPVSVGRAYTIAEIREIAQRTSAPRFEVGRYFFQRFGLILWKHHSISS